MHQTTLLSNLGLKFEMFEMRWSFPSCFVMTRLYAGDYAHASKTDYLEHTKRIIALLVWNTYTWWVGVLMSIFFLLLLLASSRFFFFLLFFHFVTTRITVACQVIAKRLSTARFEGHCRAEGIIQTDQCATQKFIGGAFFCAVCCISFL